MNTYLRDFTVTIIDEYHKVIEDQIKIVLRPKPEYCPKIIWYWLIKKMIYQEVRRVY